MEELITSGPKDNLDSILEKIKSGENLKEKFDIYTLFRLTHPGYTIAVNMSLQIWEPYLWKTVKKAYYPTFWDKLMNKLKY